MAKVTRRPGILPSGKSGDVVYYKKGDEVFAREWVMPNDPKTPAQVEQRRRFAQAVAAWRALSDAEKEKYGKRAEALGRTGYQLFMSEFKKPLG